MHAKTLPIKIGDFFFKYRNILFPVILAALFLSFRPAHTYAGNHEWVVLKNWIAVAVAGSGIALRASVIGFAYIKRGGLSKKVYAENLVTEGFFGVCRNPLYVGNMLVYTAAFLTHGNPYVIVIGTLGYFLIYRSIVAAEEYFLRNKFGEAYDAYCKDVPRWGLKLGRLKESTEGMTFNVKRAIVKDYSTVCNVIIALTLIKLLERWYFDPISTFNEALVRDEIVVGAVLAVTASIAVAKKRKILTL